MNEKRFIELQLGAAKARLQCLEEACIDGTQRRLAIYEIAYWQSKLDELGDDGFQQPFDVFNALKKASEWVAPIQATSSKEAP